MSTNSKPIRSLILFGSPKKLTNAHKPVHTIGNPKMPHGALSQPAYYVRMQVVSNDVDVALDKAGKLIMDGETVLNTVPHPDNKP